MKFRTLILTGLLLFSFSTSAQETTTIEHHLEMKTRPQYYDHNFYGKLQTSATSDTTQFFKAYAIYMSELDSFVAARRLRLDPFLIEIDHLNEKDFNVETQDHWFSQLERAYQSEKSHNSTFDSFGSNRMKSVLGFKSLHNFLGSLIFTKAQLNPGYRAALTRTMTELGYFAKMIGVASYAGLGSEIEKALAQDLVGLLSSKTGAVHELNRIKIVSYSLTKQAPANLMFRTQVKELIEGTGLKRIGTEGAAGVRTCLGVAQ